MIRTIRIGTRQSPLALRQTELVLAGLRKVWPEVFFQIILITTKGDKLVDVSLNKVGDKGFFTKELEAALLKEEIDLAVHSMKDLPSCLPEGLTIGAVMVRHDPREALISRNNLTFAELPAGALVGTSSPRRKAQLLHCRPDLDIRDMRGNVDTRIKKLERENLDAIVLAAAGIVRLGLRERITEILDTTLCLPAVGQGALGVEIRVDNELMLEMVKSLNDPDTSGCVKAERTLLEALQGGCQVPVGALAECREDTIVLQALVANSEGSRILRGQLSGKREEAEQIGLDLARQLLRQGAGEILDSIQAGGS
ncbi:MAG: hydroxymethylbilane synthase [Desulfitobacteriaceae bacterium]|nr:hydroxymethylbilane synthase [Clostridia bacterium]MDD4345481.1 hydroxymethylbilane synthase [Desulfitobacteriaceae bacterium]MDD4400626.1 hydroxymethylbilane synthase [Desulfitobacteriaceae bacterium]